MRIKSAPSGRISTWLTEKLADSLSAPLPTITHRRVHGTATLPGKATAVIGMRRAGKTFFLHQVRLEQIGQGVPRDRLPYINFEDERLAGIEADQLSPLVETFYRQHPTLRGRETVTWCFDEIQVVPGWERFVRRLIGLTAFAGDSNVAARSRLGSGDSPFQF